MTKAQKLLSQFRSHLESKGLQADRWGNYKINIKDGREYRFKLNKTSWRFERRSGIMWMRVSSRYYSSDDSLSAASNHIEIANNMGRV